MIVGLSTVFERSLHDRSALPDAVIDLALRLEAGGLVLDSGLSKGLFAELSRRLAVRRDVLPVWALECPCPVTRASRAALSAVDRDEAEAAVGAAEETLARAGELGAGMVVLRLGEVAALRRDWPSVRHAFLCARLDADGRQRLVDERTVRVAPHLDSARRSVDRLTRVAERHGLVLGIRNPSKIIDLPSPDELALLLDDLAGAPVAPLFDTAAAHLDDAMGFQSLATVAAAWKSAPLALVADACGPVTGLVPGSGEIDLPSLGLAAFAQTAFHPSSGLSEAELREGMRRLRAMES